MKATTRHAQHWTEAEMRELIGMWLAGKEVDEIGAHFGTSRFAILKMATRMRADGVPLPRRTRGHKADRSYKPWTQEEVEYVVRRRRERATAEAMAIELGRSHGAVQEMIRKLRAEGVEVGMLGCGVRRLWNPETLKVACAGRGLALVVDKSADDAQAKELKKAIASQQSERGRLAYIDVGDYIPSKVAP